MIVWYAKGGGIARWGPFASQVEAVRAMRLAPVHRERTPWGTETTPIKDKTPRYPDDMMVWPEEEEV